MKDGNMMKNKYFYIYLIISIVVLFLISYRTLYEALSGKGYLYVASTESPAYLFTLFSFILKIFNKPLVAEIVLYYFLLTIFSSITIYIFLVKIIKIVKPNIKSELVYLSSIIGGLVYTFYPRILITDVGPSFLVLKALLPLLLSFSINIVISNSQKYVFKNIITYSAVLALGYLVTYDPRLIIHSILLTEVLIISLTFSLKYKFKDTILKILSPLVLLFLTLMLSAPRVYNDIFLRTLPIGAGIAYVRNAFLYSWSTYLTAFMSMPAFLFPFYYSRLGSFSALLIIPSIVVSILIILGISRFRSERTLLKFLLIMIVFLIIFIKIFCSYTFQKIPLIVNLAFSKPVISFENKVPLIKYFFLLFRAPRFLDDFLHLFLSISIALLIATILTEKKKILRNILFILSLVLIITTLIVWLIPINGQALIFNTKAIREAKYYDEFLRSVHGNTSTSLKVMLYHGTKPGGYLIKYIYPVRPYWRADGTIANFIYEYLREKIFNKDLFAIHTIMCLYDFRYIIVNTINGPDMAINVLNNTNYFSFLEKIGSFYIFKIKDCNRKYTLFTNYVFVIGGLETYMKMLRTIVANSNTNFVPIVPLLDDSWGYNINYILKNVKIIIFMSRKSLIDLLFSYILLDKKYDILLIPSKYVYKYDPLHQWSPAYSTYAFHGIFPYFNWFPSPYTWEYGYNPRYGFIWTKAKDASIIMKFYINNNDKYVILIRNLMTPEYSKIIVKIDNVTKVVTTQDKLSKYSYLKVINLGTMNLRKGWHTIKIVNLYGFNMINLILIIKKDKFIKYYHYLTNMIKNKNIIKIYLNDNKLNNNSIVRLLSTLMNINSSNMNNNAVKCNISGIFYREYQCIVHNMTKEYSILVLPELYGLMTAENKNVKRIPIMYVLQGFGNISYGKFIINDIRKRVLFYEWIFVFINIFILIFLNIKIMIKGIKYK